MPYALFSSDAKLSKTYPTEADVWKIARRSGLVVDVVSEEEVAAPRPVLDQDYEIKPCRPDPHEDPVQNKADAEREARLELELNS
jgi:hypothetical protein